MGMFERLQQNTDVDALYSRFQQNPMEFLVRSGLRIPDSITEPRALLEHLARTNQVPTQYQQAVNRILGR